MVEPRRSTRLAKKIQEKVGTKPSNSTPTITDTQLLHVPQASKQLIEDPYPRFERHYPNMRQRNFIVNRCFKNTPKPPVHNRKADLGNYIHIVPDEIYESRELESSVITSYPRARVVGESIFGYNSNHDRLLQLLEEDTGRMFYVSDADVHLPLFT